MIPVPVWRRHLTGLLIFRAVAEPQNSGKSVKSSEIHKNTQNSSKFGRSLIKYPYLYNIFETYLSYWGYLHAVNLQIYLETSSLRRANKVPKLRGVDYVAKTRHNQIPAKWADFSANLSLKLPRNLPFSATYQKPRFKLGEFNKRSKDVFALVVKLLLIPIALSIDVVFIMLRENPCRLQT